MSNKRSTYIYNVTIFPIHIRDIQFQVLVSCILNHSRKKNEGRSMSALMKTHTSYFKRMLKARIRKVFFLCHCLHTKNTELKKYTTVRYWIHKI